MYLRSKREIEPPDLVIESFTPGVWLQWTLRRLLSLRVRGESGSLSLRDPHPRMSDVKIQGGPLKSDSW